MSLEVFSAGSCTYFLATRVLVDMALGRLKATVAVVASEDALRVNPSSRQGGHQRGVASARSGGNTLFKEGMFREACAAYE